MQSLISFSSATICLLIGYFVYAKDRRRPINLLFLIYNILIFVWNSGDFVILSFLNNQVVATWYDRFSQIGGILLSPVFAILSRLLSGEDLKKAAQRKMIKFFLISAVLLLLTVPTSSLIQRVELNPYKETPGVLLGVEILLFLTSYFYGLVIILKAKKIAPLSQQNRLTYFSIGTTMVLSGALLWFVIVVFFPGHSTAIIYFFEISYALITAYAILRYSLLNIDVVIKKTTVYTTLTTLIGCIYISIVLIFESVLHSFFGITSLVIRIAAVLIIAITVQPLRSQIEIIIDKLFFRDKLDYQAAIADFTHLLVTTLELRELLNLIVSLSNILNTRHIAMLLFDEDTARYKIRASTGLYKIAKEIEFDSQSDLVRLLISTRKVIIRSKLKGPSAGNDYPIVHSEIDSLKATIVIPIFIKNALKGILVLGGKLSDELYSSDDINMLATLADEIGIAIENAQLYEEQKKTYLETVHALSQAIEASDEYTRGHSDRVTQLAIQIARQLKMNRTDIDTLKIACILHDVGKIGIIKEVLHKPGKLSEAEFNIIKKHPALGEEIISHIAFLTPIKLIVRHHHEHFDGRGYPDGLKSENIPYLSRIIAVADTYDAMTSERPYRPALSTEIALAEIKRCSGTQFDPEIVKAFLDLDHSI